MDVYDRRVYDPTQRPPLTPAIALARINRYLTRWVYRTLQMIVGHDFRVQTHDRDVLREVASDDPDQWAQEYQSDYRVAHGVWPYHVARGERRRGVERYRMRMGYSSRWGEATSRSRLPEYRKSRI
jgi:hypothetical protein